MMDLQLMLYLQRQYPVLVTVASSFCGPDEDSRSDIRWRQPLGTVTL